MGSLLHCVEVREPTDFGKMRSFMMLGLFVASLCACGGGANAGVTSMMTKGAMRLRGGDGDVEAVEEGDVAVGKTRKEIDMEVAAIMAGEMPHFVRVSI